MWGSLRPPFLAKPNVSTYCDQFVMSSGLFTGPAGANPTKAAMAVPTPSIGLGPVFTSSIYTPGDRYSAMIEAPSSVRNYSRCGSHIPLRGTHQPSSTMSYDAPGTWTST